MTDFDVVLFGPTGVTGREVARYLGRRAPELGMSWAVAGRNEKRIRDALDAVDAKPDGVLVADVNDQASIEAMVASATVVANLVGPYARYGEPVYAACAAGGTHQLDLTGEIDWVRAMIDHYDDEATRSGAKIVPTSGFEALPFDLGVLLAAQQLHERTGDPVVSVDAAVTTETSMAVSSLTDAVSGGTFLSMVDVIRRGIDARLKDPYTLDTPGSRATGRYDLRPRKHSGTHQWLAPMVPSMYLNPAVVHRTASLLRDSGDSIHADNFMFQEGMAVDSMVPKPIAGPAAALMCAMSVGMTAAGSLPEQWRGRVADWMERVGPKSGDGPKPEDLDKWSYRLDLRATDARGATQDVVVEADTHPGYKSTAMMVGEAALALAESNDSLPDGAGFLTPATALGLGSLDRFGAAEVRFSARSRPTSA